MGVCVCASVFSGAGDGAERKCHHWLVPQMLSQTDRGEKKARFVSKMRSLKSGLFSTDLQPCAPGKETITLPLNTHRARKKMATKINLNERGERGKSDACLFSQLF